MKTRSWIMLSVLVVVLGACIFFGYRKWNAPHGAARANALALMPADANAVLFADFVELRQAPFFAKFYAWAPKPEADPDYAQFVKETGFDYERSLDRVAIAVEKHGQDSAVLAILDGKFDRHKISAYALKAGSSAKTGGLEIFSVALSESSRKITFTFLKDDRIALAIDADVGAVLGEKRSTEDAAEWRARFERLAGSPVFAVVRQDAAAGAALTARAPGGLRSPQLSALLDQLQWITLAGKPETDRLRVVAEGECIAEETARQLKDLMNGVIILAQAGLNDAKARQQLDPAAREAYLELLRSTDVSKVDRGDTKSVRLVFDLTRGFLEAARRSPPILQDSTPGKPLPGRATSQRKGHT